MFRAVSDFIANLKWRRLMRDLDRADADAHRRGDTRAIGKVHKARQRRVHTALGWRHGGARR